MPDVEVPPEVLVALLGIKEHNGLYDPSALD
jgi:hypothetical protein